MSQEVKLPELGENIETVDVANVLVSVGDTVQADQPLLEVETEKASMEIPSPSAGKVSAVHVSAGDSVQVGQVLVTLDGGGGAPAEDGSGGDERKKKKKRKKRAKEKAKPEKDEAARVEEPAGRKDEGKEEEGEDEPEKEPEEKEPEEKEPEEKESEEEEPEEKESEEEPREDEERPEEESSRKRPSSKGGPAGDEVSPLADPVPAAPSIRRLARELGIDLREVRGSGPGGRISAEDVKEHTRAVVRGAGGPGGGPARAALPDLSAYGDVEREPIGKVRRVTAENMARSWALVPHVTQHDRADVTEMEAFRKRYGARVEAAGGKLTVTAILLKIVAAALRKFPKFNASLDLEAGEVVFRRYVHVGVAVDTDRGLLVPVVRDADRKSITDLAVELNDLAGRARSRKLKPDEMRGAGFTVSNLGGLGTTDFSPIVNWPEAAILGVGRATTEAVWRDDGFEPRLVLPLSLSYDHRLIDGAEAARFLRWLAEAMEQPMLLVLESGS